MKALLFSVVVFVTSLSTSIAAGQVLKVDWILSAIAFDDLPAVEFTRLKVDIGAGAGERYFPASAALLSQQPDTPVFPLTGTCLYADSQTIKCTYSFERGSLTLELNTALGGSYSLRGPNGEQTHTGTVFYTGIVS